MDHVTKRRWKRIHQQSTASTRFHINFNTEIHFFQETSSKDQMCGIPVKQPDTIAKSFQILFPKHMLLARDINFLLLMGGTLSVEWEDNFLIN